MSDQFGALAIPLEAPALGTSAGDPLLTTTLSFFKAVLNANAPAAWNAVFKDNQTGLVVRSTVDDNPQNAVFTERDLPALFFWRESADEAVRIADDWLTQRSVCRLIWMMPWAISVKRTLRSSIYNGIARALLVASEANRDPAWVDDGDPEAIAQTLGSSFFGRAGWLEFHVGKWKPTQVPVAIQGKGAKPQMYEALSIECVVVERLITDLTRFDAIAGIDVTLKTPDGGVGDGGFVTGEQILV